jgi:hypothetical protein
MADKSNLTMFCGSSTMVEYSARHLGVKGSNTPSKNLKLIRKYAFLMNLWPSKYTLSQVQVKKISPFSKLTFLGECYKTFVGCN